VCGSSDILKESCVNDYCVNCQLVSNEYTQMMKVTGDSVR